MKKLISKGFTIIELAVALTIVALIVGGMAIPLSTRMAEQQYTDTQTNIDRAMEALVGFAIQNRRLPCPDMRTAGAGTDDRDGVEDFLPAAGLISSCNSGVGGTNSDPTAASWGDLPWRTLGLQAPYNQDAWSNRLRYAVFTPLVTQTPSAFTCPPIGGIVPPAVAGFSNMGCTTSIGGFAAQLDIRCANPPTTPPATPSPGCIATPVANPYQVTSQAVFVVYSHGANGLGATNINDLSAVIAAPTVAIPDQLANHPASETDAAPSALRRQFVFRTRSLATSNSGEYDDVLSFMSSNTFAAKMLAAGVWP